MEDLALELRCRVGSLPLFYLGLPLGAHHNLVATWDRVEERFQRRLLSFPKVVRLLSFRALYLAYLSYVFSLNALKVQLRLECIKRNFLWGGVLWRKSLILSSCR